jgi:hypothetical protein
LGIDVERRRRPYPSLPGNGVFYAVAGPDDLVDRHRHFDGAIHRIRIVERHHSGWSSIELQIVYQRATSFDRSHFTHDDDV